MRTRLAIQVASLAAATTCGTLLYGCSGKAAPPSWGPVDGYRAMDHVKVMVGHGPRPAGSVPLSRTAEYLSKQLRAIGLEPNVHSWAEPGQPRVKGKFRNIWAQIDGEDPKNGPILMLAAHYDTKLCEGHENPKHNIHFVGAIDGAGGPATLLELARHLKGRKNIPNIWILFLDGEESVPWDWKDEQSLYGSRKFVEKMQKDKALFPKGLPARIRAFVLIDLIGSKDLKIDKDGASHPTLTGIFGDAAKTMGESKRMYENTSTMTDDHIPFKNAGLKVIDLIDFVHRAPGAPVVAPYAQWWHTEDDNLDAMDPVSLAFVGNLLWNAMPLLEKKLYPSTKK